MTYSNKEMEALCLGLAEKAEPLEAAALREVAKNYETAPEQPHKSEFMELSVLQVMAIVALVFLVWTPIAVWLVAGFPEEKKPPGSVVEQLSGFTPTQDGRWTTRTYKFTRKESFVKGYREWVFPKEPIPPVIYEGTIPLPKANYELQALSQENIWRFVTIRTSDGSDPNKNGRRYYIAIPMIDSAKD